MQRGYSVEGGREVGPITTAELRADGHRKRDVCTSEARNGGPLKPSARHLVEHTDGDVGWIVQSRWKKRRGPVELADRAGDALSAAHQVGPALRSGRGMAWQ
jgi:hypothetical protein